MHMALYCPKLKCEGTVDITKCLYRCPRGTVIQCDAYAKVYVVLEEIKINDAYIEKYGPVKIPVPLRFWRRRKRFRNGSV